MNNLEVYIRESIFSGGAQEKLSGVQKELLDELRKYTYDNAPESRRMTSPWEKGEVKIGKNGIEIKGRGYNTTLTFINPDFEKFPQFNISKVTKCNIAIMLCSNLHSLEGLFTKDCTIDGILLITANEKLVSLKGSPKACTEFIANANPCLNVYQVMKSPKRVETLYRWAHNSKSVMNLDTFTDMIKDHLIDCNPRIEAIL